MERRPTDIKSRIAEYCIDKNNNRCLYSIPLSAFEKLRVLTWNKNREVDAARVSEIAETIKKTKRVVGIIYLAHLDRSLVCFDGNHRRLALEKITQVENILVMVMWNATVDAVVEEFNNINKAVSVSSIHLDSCMSDSVKVLITDYVSKLAKTYPMMVSAKARCIRPHFNRDILEQDLADLLEEDDTLTGEEMIKTIDIMNKEFVDGLVNPSSSCRADANAKCDLYGLWLFCDGRTINRRHFFRVRKDAETGKRTPRVTRGRR